MNTQGAIALNRNKANGTISNDPISQRDINKVLELTRE